MMTDDYEDDDDDDDDDDVALLLLLLLPLLMLLLLLLLLLLLQPCREGGKSGLPFPEPIVDTPPVTWKHQATGTSRQGADPPAGSWLLMLPVASRGGWREA